MTGSRLRRRLVVGTVIALLVALAGALAVKVAGALRLRSAESRFRSEVGSLDPATYRPSMTDPGRDAARRLTGAAEALVLPRDEQRGALFRLLETGPAQWSPEARATLQAVLAENASALALLREVPSRGPVTLSIDYPRGAQAKLPNLLDAMNAAKLLHLDALWALERGDVARTLADVETLGALATALQRESALIVVLIGIAAERIQGLTVHEAVAHPGLGEEDLERLRHAIPREDLRAALRRALGMEGASLVQLFRAGNPEDWQGIGEEAPAGWRAFTAVTGDLILARQLRRICRLSAQLDADVAAFREFRQGERDWPNLAASIPRFALADRLRHLVLVALELRAAGLQNGGYPEDLPAQHTAADPFTGASLRYARSADGAVVLDAPDAAVLFEEFELKGTRPPFRWELPAPATAPSKRPA